MTDFSDRAIHLSNEFVRAVQADVDLGDLLACALQDAARRLGGTDELVRNRPGSWEAEHVVRLGQLLDEPISNL